jgi:hypothetical protein
VCPVLSHGRLYVLVIPTSPKQQDLLRDGRYALQTFPQPKKDSAEFYITGRAEHIEDPALRRVVLNDAKHRAHESEILFELMVDQVMHTTWEGGEAGEIRPLHRKWRASERQECSGQPTA